MQPQPLQSRSRHVDEHPHRQDTRRAFVPGTVWGTASIQNLSSVVSFYVKAGRPLPGRRTLPTSEPESSRSFSAHPIVLRARPVARDAAVIPPC
jgi:hypothetical protein